MALKEILFLYCAKQCAKCEAMLPEQLGRITEYAKFKALHSVIEEADLEDEYQEWRRANGFA